MSFWTVVYALLFYAATILLMENYWVQPAAKAMSDLEGYVLQQPLTDRLVEDLVGAAGAEE